MSKPTDMTPKISASEWRRLNGMDTAVPKPKGRKQKYNAQSTVVDGLHFPSKLEAAVWCALKMDKAAYREVRRYPSVKFPDDTWKVDFACERYVPRNAWTPIYVEAKGAENNDYLRKLKLYEKYGDRPLEIWKGTHKKPYLWKTVIPKGISI